MKKLAKPLLLLFALVIVSYVAHELSHVFVARGLGYAADWDVGSGAVTIRPSPIGFDSTLIFLAGGLGGSIAMLLLWLPIRAYSFIFIFLIVASLSYAAFEVSAFSWASPSWAVLLSLAVGYYVSLATTLLQRRSQSSGGWT